MNPALFFGSMFFWSLLSWIFIKPGPWYCVWVSFVGTVFLMLLIAVFLEKPREGSQMAKRKMVYNELDLKKDIEKVWGPKSLRTLVYKTLLERLESMNELNCKRCVNGPVICEELCLCCGKYYPKRL